MPSSRFPGYFIIVQGHFLVRFRRRVCGPIDYVPVELTFVFAERASVQSEF